MIRSERSPYKGGGAPELVPLYLYEGKRSFLHPTRAGLKLSDEPRHRVDLFLDYRFEGFPYGRTPASLAGMQARRIDRRPRVSLSYRAGLGQPGAEILHDADNVSKGAELRLGYSSTGQRPLAPAGRPDPVAAQCQPEQLLLRRAPGRGHAAAPGIPARRRHRRCARPLRHLRSQPRAGGCWAGSASICSTPGAQQPDRRRRRPSRPSARRGLRFRQPSLYAAPGLPLHRQAAVRPLDRLQPGAGFAPLLPLDQYRGQDARHRIELGRPLVERVNGWPLDFVGYVGVLRHDEHGLQPDSWQVDAYIKAFFYGFPWSGTCDTRLGFGVGLSYAQRVPFVEERDQARRGRGTSKLLNYLDPTIDVSLGDLLAQPRLKETYFGFGASHRSGIFGDSQLLGNVNGGSNYLYTYLEWKM